MSKVIYQHNIIPQDAQDRLKKAAAIHGMGTRDEAIDQAMKDNRSQYPEKFQKPAIDESAYE